MVALFVVLTVVFFLTVDLIIAARNQAGLTGALARQAAAEGAEEQIVGGFALAFDRAYTPGHTWARLDADAVARVGVDDFGARLLGPADAIEIVEPGTSVRAGEAIATLRRRDRTVRIAAPVSGVVRAVNAGAIDEPHAAGRDPYGAGWLAEIKTNDLRRDLRGLAFGDTARRLLDESVSALHRMFAPSEALPAAADGGRALEALSDQFDDATWRAAKAQFLLDAE